LVYIDHLAFRGYMSWLSASRRRADHSLRQARSELEAKVLQRTADLRAPLQIV
jgi:C4-dicarboxylate-specific signal transduction histidine kinase